MMRHMIQYAVSNRHIPRLLAHHLPADSMRHLVFISRSSVVFCSTSRPFFRLFSNCSSSSPPRLPHPAAGISIRRED